MEDLLREVSAYLTDAMLLLVAIFLIPVAILLLGAPVALIVRLAEIRLRAEIMKSPAISRELGGGEIGSPFARFPQGQQRQRFCAHHSIRQ